MDMHKTVTVTRGMLVWLIGVILLSNLCVSIGGVFYTSHREKVADHRWCQLFRDLDRPVDPNIKDSAQRARTQQTVNRIHKLRVEHGCIKS
jgi:hypothetical protein